MSNVAANGGVMEQTLIFACSGAADVGAVADQAARRLDRAGIATMRCHAGIGGRIPAILKRTRWAQALVAIDGCSRDCVKHCLQHAGFVKFAHLRVTDLGFEKGQTDISDASIDRVADEVSALL
jgi:uncharacterized metal-binding protein